MIDETKQLKVSVPLLNKDIKELAKEIEIAVIDNDNLDVSCLSQKNFHPNEKGNSYLGSNFSNFISRY